MICYKVKKLDKNKGKFGKTCGYSGDDIRPPSTAHSDHVQQRSTFLTVNCFPFDAIVFAMLPTHGIWQ